MSGTDNTTGDQPHDRRLPDHERARIGPREPGLTCHNGYWGIDYRVDAILTGDDARARIPWSDVAIVETDLDGPMAGRQRVHCTPWDPHRDVADVAAQQGPRA